MSTTPRRTSRRARIATVLAGVLALAGLAALGSTAPAYAAAGSISGHVQGAGGGPLNSICVNVFDEASGAEGSTETDASGDYSVNVLPGSYRVRFSDCHNFAVVTEWWNDVGSSTVATMVGVADGQARELGTTVMVAGGVFSGSVVSTSGTPLKGVCVRPDRRGDDLDAAYTTLANGTFTTANAVASGNLLPGTYDLRVFSCGGADVIAQTYPGTPAGLTLASGQTISGLQIVVSQAGAITGLITQQGEMPTDDTCVAATDPSGATLASTSADPDDGGTYEIQGVPSGEVRVHFTACSSDDDLAPEWWNDSATLADATPVSVSAGVTTTAVDADLLRASCVQARSRQNSADRALASASKAKSAAATKVKRAKKALRSAQRSKAPKARKKAKVTRAKKALRRANVTLKAASGRVSSAQREVTGAKAGVASAC